MRSVAAVLALVACVHAGLWALLRTEAAAPDLTGQFASLSYAPNAHADDDDFGPRPTAEKIRADLAAIAPYTRAIRTYSTTDGSELVPPIAAEFGLKVTVGAWLGKDKDRNEREITGALELARRYSNVNAIVVGNEALLRKDLTLDELIHYIQQVKKASPVPVTTAENWDVWIQHPELASAVDFIAAHILPYWMGKDASTAVDDTIETYDKLRRFHPGKRIVIAEFGWPSAGYNYHDANPGRIAQAMVIRDFVKRAKAYGIDYNIIEAFDQPGKVKEGSVGSYWGLFDASREPKFAWTGVISNPDYVKRAGLAVLFGLLLSLPILAMAGVTATQALMLAISANVVGAWFSAIVAFWKGHYFVPGAAFALGVGILLLMPLIAIILTRLDEIAAIVLGRAPRRLITAPPLLPESFAPKVSIHIPACRESPEMLKATLDGMARSTYPNFECVLVINNTPDPDAWRSVEEHCRALGDRFKFVYVEKLAGYKAGALRLALEHTAPDAEIIGAIDADYVVHQDWLKDLVPLFADPRVGLVQSPQDHRDGDRSPMHFAMNAEYAGFFDIGMVQRNEVNAVIMHGTMCLLRRTALESAGGWESDTIVEDTDLGIRVLERGWLAHYTNRRYGHGLLPDTFEDYKRQRHRWAFGGFQLVRKHWRTLLPWADGLTREQKREFGMGWLSWLGSDLIGVVVALLNILWVPFVVYSSSGAAVRISEYVHGLAPDRMTEAHADMLSRYAERLAHFGAVPDNILTLPILAAFAVSVAHFMVLYRRRVHATVGQMAGAVFAAMALQWTVARAVGMGLVKERVPFLRTAKGGVARKGSDFPAFAEAIIAGLLLVCAITLIVTNYQQVREIDIFACVLMVQSLPFIAALSMALLEGSRFNSFAYWRGVEARIASMVASTIASTVGTKAADLLPEPVAEAINRVIATPATPAVAGPAAEQPPRPADNTQAPQ